MKSITYRSDNPFTSVDSAVPNDGFVLARPITSPKVNTLERTTLERVSSAKDLRVVRESSRNILKELVVLLQSVVGLEVGQVGQLQGLAVASSQPGGCLQMLAYIDR